jgi:gamma-D-glutamyl-L-lysine dipeptidyl-peptidase
MEYGMVAVPAAPVRRKPNHRKEMVSQLLFGETAKILKSKGDLWVKVRSLHDGYEGWMTSTLLLPVEETVAVATCEFVAADLLNEITIGEQKMYLPAGASLPFFENMPFAEKGTKGKLGEQEFAFGGNYYKRHGQIPDVVLLEKLVSPWVNVPYLWGGRTPLGVDCSGFTQVIYKQMGIDLRRDAWQQAQEGKVVKKITEAQTGDLAFFNNKEDIVHVGILLGDEKIIHASGKVRIDKIDKKGIIDAETGERKLSLKAIRRVW